jgi:hypothetical protein
MRRFTIVGVLVLVSVTMVTIPLVTAQVVDERCDRRPLHPKCAPTTTVTTTTAPPVTTTTVPPATTTTVPGVTTTTVPSVTTTSVPSATTTTVPSVTDPTVPSVTTTTDAAVRTSSPVTVLPPKRRRTQLVVANDAHQLTEILVEQDFHHIGDGEGLSSFLIADAEGVSWETRFQISSQRYGGANTAHLELFVFDSGHLNSFVINGRPFALPSDENLKAAHLPFVNKMLISIPLGLLRSGSNTIGFESGQSSATSGFDDFEFGEVVLLLSS